MADNHKRVLFVMCAMNELFFIALYLLSFSSPKLSPSLLRTHDTAQSVQPGSPVAPSMIWTTPWSAGAMEMARANKMDSSVPWGIAAVCSPVMLTKQIMNVVQMVMASNWLAEGDLAERKKQGLPDGFKAQ